MDKYELDGYISDEIQNLCTICGRNLGAQNPRQLCGKTYCEDYDYSRGDPFSVESDRPHVSQTELKFTIGNNNIILRDNAVSRTWILSSTTVDEKVLTVKTKADITFNIKDCELVWLLLTYCGEDVDVNFMNYTLIDIDQKPIGAREGCDEFGDSVNKDVYLHKVSEMIPEDLIKELLMTPIQVATELDFDSDPEPFRLSKYIPDGDWAHSAIAHTYYDIYDYFDNGGFKLDVGDGRHIWGAIRTLRLDNDGFPTYKIEGQEPGSILYGFDKGLRFHEINAILFPDVQLPDSGHYFVESLTYGFPR